jgi:hypothetical protein
VGILPAAPPVRQFDDDGPSPHVPTTPVEAYVTGLAAAERGEDITTVFYAAALCWPISDIHQWCELLANASLGYWTGTSPDPEGGRE